MTTLVHREPFDNRFDEKKNTWVTFRGSRRPRGPLSSRELCYPHTQHTNLSRISSWELGNVEAHTEWARGSKEEVGSLVANQKSKRIYLPEDVQLILSEIAIRIDMLGDTNLVEYIYMWFFNRSCFNFVVFTLNAMDLISPQLQTNTNINDLTEFQFEAMKSKS